MRFILVGLLLSLRELPWVGLVTGLWSASLTIPGIPPVPDLTGGPYWLGSGMSVRMLQTFGAELLRSRELRICPRLEPGGNTKVWWEPPSIFPPGMMMPTMVSGALCSPARIV